MSKKSNTGNPAVAMPVTVKPQIAPGKSLKRRILDNWQLYVMLQVYSNVWYSDCIQGLQGKPRHVGERMGWSGMV